MLVITQPGSTATNIYAKGGGANGDHAGDGVSEDALDAAEHGRCERAVANEHDADHGLLMGAPYRDAGPSRDISGR